MFRISHAIIALVVPVSFPLGWRSPSDDYSVTRVPATADSTNYCQPVNDWTNGLRTRITRIVTAPGARMDSLRARIKLPLTTADQVSIVTDDSTCTAAYMAQVNQKHDGDTTQLGTIALVRIDSTRYVLQDLGRRAGEWQLLDIYDASFNYLSSVTQ